MLRLRTSVDQSGGLSWVRVDQLVALVLLVEIELQVWLGPSSSGRLLAAFGGLLFSLPVAVRRRWPLAGMLVIATALAVKTLLGNHPGDLSNVVAILPALLLLNYGMGAFAPPLTVAVGIGTRPTRQFDQYRHYPR